MSLGILIRDSQGQRRVERGDFPLALGGDGCALRLDPAASEPRAWLGLHEDALFLQAAGAGSVLHNGAPVQTSSWLHAGDVVTCGNGLLRLQLESGTRVLAVEDGGAANITAPPVVEARALKSGGGDDAPEPLASIQYSRRRAVGAAAAGARARRWPVGVAAIMVGIALVLWFLSSGVAVQLKVTPEAARVRVTGSWLTPRFGSTLFVRPGAYTLHAELAGHATAEQRFEVGARANQSVSVVLQKLPGQVRVQVPASGALRLGAGEPMRVPGTLALPAGRQPLTIEVPGYLPWSGELEVQGEGRAQVLAPPLVANSAVLAVSSEPAGATVLVDGRSIGVTPLRSPLPAGTHPVELRLAGFKPWATDVLIKAGVDQTLGPVRLGLPDAVLLVRSKPSAARVLVGGVYRGLTPLRLVLRAETETSVTLSAPGYSDLERAVRLAPAASSALDLELAPVLGTVNVRASPADAEVFVDGQSRGTGNLSLQLPAIAHRIEVRRAGYVPFSATVTPRPGFEQALEAALQTEAQLRVARNPAVIRAIGSIELRLMPAGRYVMGSPRREAGRRANEGQRPVELRRLFYLGTREITNAEFRQFQSEHKSGMFGGVTLNLDNQPVAQVTWQEAAAFCNWLSQKDGLPAAYEMKDGELQPVRPMNTGYRLPSEAEWEWAARHAAGSAERRYPWGNDLPVPKNAGNYADQSARIPLQDVIPGYDDGFVGAAPVGSYQPSALGIHDLGGNVSEWTTDVYATSFSVEAEAIDPMYLAAGSQHAVRGASWRSVSNADLRVAARAAGSGARDDLGFRIARYAE